MGTVDAEVAETKKAKRKTLTVYLNLFYGNLLHPQGASGTALQITGRFVLSDALSFPPFHVRHNSAWSRTPM
jgi:hypothetical protein